MDRYEREKISDLPYEFKPLGAWTYFLLTILYALPIVGFIMLIVHAIDDSNINRRSFARSYFCKFLILIIILFLFYNILSSYLYEFLQSLSETPYYY